MGFFVKRFSRPCTWLVSKKQARERSGQRSSFAERHFKAVVALAQRSTARIESEFDLELTTGYVIGALLFNLAAHLVLSQEVALTAGRGRGKSAALGLALPGPGLAPGLLEERRGAKGPGVQDAPFKRQFFFPAAPTNP